MVRCKHILPPEHDTESEKSVLPEQVGVPMRCAHLSSLSEGNSFSELCHTPASEGDSSLFPKSPRSVACSGAQLRAHTRQNKTVAIDDKWTELALPYPPPSLLPWRHQSTKPRDQEISIKDSLVDTGLESQYANEILSPLRVRWEI